MTIKGLPGLRALALLVKICLFASVLVLLPATPASAATLEVTTTVDELADNADCSLREAIENANNNNDAAEDACGAGDAGLDTITFEDEDATYEITISGPDEDANQEGDFDILDDLAIEGSTDEDDDLIIDGGGDGTFNCNGDDADATDRVFHVFDGAASLTLENLQVQRGELEGTTTADQLGGGIYSQGDALTLDTVEVRNNFLCAEDGDAFGGGIAVDDGNLTITDSTIELNDSDTNTSGESFGGGIYHVGGTLDIDSSTINDNVVTGVAAGDSDGGGLYAAEGGSLVNSTISGNVAGQGGGIFFDTTSTTDLSLTHVTITDNDEGGLATEGTNASVVLPEATIFADQAGGDDCDLEVDADLDTQGFNLDSDGTCNLDESGEDDVESGDADLDDLEDNDGPTETHLPDEGSDAVDHIDDSDCTESEDQRGEDRPDDADDKCDIGAVELTEDEKDDGGSSGGSGSSADDELDATPESGSNTLPGDTSHSVTAEFDEDEIADDDEDLIDFKIISGPNEKSDDDESDFECSLSGDECTITYTSNGTAGTDLICAWNDFDDDDSYSKSGSSSDGGDCDSETLSGGTDDDNTDLVEARWVTATSPSPSPSPTITDGPDGEPQTIRAPSLVTIGFSRRAGAFKGRVLSAKKRCIKGRRVTVKKVGGAAVGSDRTNNEGRYLIQVNKANGNYIAVVARKQFTAANGDTIVCQRARSDSNKV